MGRRISEITDSDDPIDFTPMQEHRLFSYVDQSQEKKYELLDFFRFRLLRGCSEISDHTVEYKRMPLRYAPLPWPAAEPTRELKRSRTRQARAVSISRDTARRADFAWEAMMNACHFSLARDSAILFLFAP